MQAHMAGKFGSPARSRTLASKAKASLHGQFKGPVRKAGSPVKSMGGAVKAMGTTAKRKNS